VEEGGEVKEVKEVKEVEEGREEEYEVHFPATGRVWYTKLRTWSPRQPF
jgi:hypothetical protein